MPILVDTIFAPAHWASALVNGDYSSFIPDADGGAAEKAAIDSWLADLTKEGWYVVDVARDADGNAKDPYFTHFYRLYGGTARCGEVLDYVIHKAA